MYGCQTFGLVAQGSVPIRLSAVRTRGSQEVGCRSRGVEFAPDSSLEGSRFELPVPRATHGWPRAIIVGFGCKPTSLDYLRLPSVDITEGGTKRNLGTEALSRAEPEVRIHFP